MSAKKVAAKKAPAPAKKPAAKRPAKKAPAVDPRDTVVADFGAKLLDAATYFVTDTGPGWDFAILELNVPDYGWIKVRVSPEV